MTRHTDLLAAQQWARPLLDRARHTGPTPPAGTAPWRALDDTDPRKLAALIRPALAWLHEATPEVIAERLRAELDQLDLLHDRRSKAAALDLADAADWTAIATGPTHRELERRRAQPGHLAALSTPDPQATARWVTTGTSTTEQMEAAA